MTISAPTFQRLQTGVTSADDLRVRGPVNAALAWLSGSLVTQLNTHFGAISQSNSVQIAAQISSYVSAKAAFSAHKNGANQVSISSATAVAITFGTEEFDNGGFFASNAWTPPNGRSAIQACITFTAANAVDAELLEVRLLKDGVVHRRASERRSGVGIQSVHLASTVSSSGTNAFSVAVFKGGAGDGTVEGAAIDTWFTGHVI